MTTLFFGFLILGLLAIYAVRTALTITGKRTIGPYIRFVGAVVLTWLMFSLVGWASNKLLPSFTEHGVKGAAEVVAFGKRSK